MTDLIDELRAECLSHCRLPIRPDGPTAAELAVLGQHVRWRAAAEIDRLRRSATAAWQPMESAPKDGSPVLLFCPGLAGHVAKEIVVGACASTPTAARSATGSAMSATSTRARRSAVPG